MTSLEVEIGNIWNQGISKDGDLGSRLHLIEVLKESGFPLENSRRLWGMSFLTPSTGHFTFSVNQANPQ